MCCVASKKEELSECVTSSGCEGIEAGKSASDQSITMKNYLATLDYICTDAIKPRRLCSRHLYDNNNNNNNNNIYQGSHASWKVMEFKWGTFEAWKIMENDCGHEKSWKSHGIPPIGHEIFAVLKFQCVNCLNVSLLNLLVFKQYIEFTTLH